ncbi:hypothetical protein BHE74_00008098 [Ensete ventricosum]|nr:hypothetical protein BHE74_00008098 [Ensete ventricosum]RZR80879.1 hypothetical protein BHM03_00006985 [Ensete ventricosum]
MGLHLHLPHKIMAGHGRRRGGEEEEEGIRKGWMGIRVGGEGEERQRFVVPVDYLSHPLFVGLLKEAEEEYGFNHQGAITIPCHVEHFRRVQDIIDRDCNAMICPMTTTRPRPVVHLANTSPPPCCQSPKRRSSSFHGSWFLDQTRKLRPSQSRTRTRTKDELIKLIVFLLPWAGGSLRHMFSRMLTGILKFDVGALRTGSQMAGSCERKRINQRDRRAASDHWMRLVAFMTENNSSSQLDCGLCLMCCSLGDGRSVSQVKEDISWGYGLLFQRCNTHVFSAGAKRNPTTQRNRMPEIDKKHSGN